MVMMMMVMVMIFTYDMRMIARAGSARASPSAKSISPAEALVTFNSIQSGTAGLDRPAMVNPDLKVLSSINHPMRFNQI